MADVEAYFTHIRGGRRPSPEAVDNLRRRYELVGGGTPLLAITEEVRAKLQAALSGDEPLRVYVGMKHWHPYIADVVLRMADDGVTDVTAIALAPHYSRMSVGAYERELVDSAARIGNPFAIRVVKHWFDHPAFVAMMRDLVREGLAGFGRDTTDEIAVVFTAHSLPERIREWNDPYENEVAGSAALVANAAGVVKHRVAWQSAGGTAEPWIGPDILDALAVMRDEGVRRVLQVPIGFVCDHLEILYDIDIEAASRAASLGMELRRTRLPNASDAFIRILADIVRHPTTEEPDDASQPAAVAPAAP
jgi:ferrochelatase